MLLCIICIAYAYIRWNLKKVKLIIIIDKIISGFAILNEEGSTNSHGLAQSASTSL